MWEIITSISAAVTAVLRAITAKYAAITALFTAITAIGVLFAFSQLMEARRTRRIEAYNTFLEIWGNVEEREARRFVFREFKFGSLPSLTDDERKKVEMVLASCNRISYLTLKKLVPEEDVLRLTGRPIVRLWDYLHPFIEARREEARRQEVGQEPVSEDPHIIDVKRTDVGEKLDDADPYAYMAHLQEFVKKYRTKVMGSPRVSNGGQ